MNAYSEMSASQSVPAPASTLQERHVKFADTDQTLIYDDDNNKPQINAQDVAKLITMHEQVCNEAC